MICKLERPIPNYVEIDIPSVTITNLQETFNNIEERREKLLNHGEASAQEFLDKCEQNSSEESNDTEISEENNDIETPNDGMDTLKIEKTHEYDPILMFLDTMPIA